MSRPDIQEWLQGLQLGRGDTQRSLPRSGHLPPAPPHTLSPNIPGTLSPPASLLMTIPHQLSPPKQQGGPSPRLVADNQEGILISETVKVGKGNEGRWGGPYGTCLKSWVGAQLHQALGHQASSWLCLLSSGPRGEGAWENRQAAGLPCSAGGCPPGEDTLAGSPGAGWEAGSRRSHSSALGQGHKAQQSGIWGPLKTVSGAVWKQHSGSALPFPPPGSWWR